MRAVVRSSLFTYSIAEHVVRALWKGRKHLRLSGPADRRRILSELSTRSSRRMLDRLKVDVEVIGEENFPRDENFLLVSNHMSYFDAVVLSSVRPVVFVTSVDMGEVPVLGQLAELGGSLFVERRHRGRVAEDLDGMSEALRAGFNVLLFPEGTSTNGLEILPFKKSLLAAAARSGKDILPLVLKYVEVDGRPFGPDCCDLVCWHGDMKFAPHVYGLMSARTLRARVEFLPRIKVEAGVSFFPNDLAQRCHRAISEVYFRKTEVLADAN